MNLYTPAQNLFRQLQSVLNELTPEEFTTPSLQLSGSSIAQHTRHIIELFLELNKGYNNGVVNYEKRQRNHRIENDKSFATDLLDAILEALEKPDKILLLDTDLSTDNSGLFTISTSYYRELIFNIEHTVHHMALIKVALNEISAREIPKNFGVAVSTIKHNHRLCAQ